MLAGVSEEAHAALTAYLEPAYIENGVVLYEPGTRIGRVYFPQSAVVSIVQIMQEGTAAEIGLVGREGVSGIDVVLREGIATGRHLCQVPGTALSMPAAELRRLAETAPSVRGALLRYTGGYCAMLAQLIACNRLHRVEQRCARWLLMTVDRISQDHFPMTQERLSMMLGAQRPTVTAVLTSLRDAACIETLRGELRITDRECLERFACECYQICAGYFDL